jgi:hypothetical protein
VAQEDFTTMTGAAPYNDVACAGTTVTSKSFNADPLLAADGVSLGLSSPAIDAAVSTFGCGTTEQFWDITADGNLTDFFGKVRVPPSNGGTNADIGANETN